MVCRDAGRDGPLDIAADIREAWTPRSAVYRDSRIHELLIDRAFARSWQLAPEAAEALAPGEARPFTLLEGSLDEPLLLTRDESGDLHCLSNVCTHRGNLVVPGACRAKVLRCGYHGRRFGLDGRFLSMPEFDEARGFPARTDDLPELGLERWGPLAFTGIAPACPIEDWLGAVRARVGWLPFDEFRLDTTTSRDYTVAANWMLYCDNYLEGFHIPFVHEALTTALDYGAYTTETFDHGSLQLGIAARGAAAFEPPGGHPDAGRAVAGYYFWLFPNLMLNFYPWGLSANLVQPLAVDRTRVRFFDYVWRAERRGAGAGTDLHRVELEDEAVVKNVQRGVRSRLYERGRYSPTQEIGVHHFHRLLARSLADAA